MQFALSQVQGRLASLRSSLPAGLEVTAERLTPSVFPMLQYELTGADPLVLRDLADFVVRPRLTGLPDAGEIEVQGGRVREISVQLDPVRLVANHVTTDQVAQAITAQDQAAAVGRVDRDYRQYGIVVSGLTDTPEAVGRVVVRQAGARPLRVADLGSVSYGAEDLFQIVAGNGRPAALVNVARQPNGTRCDSRPQSQMRSPPSGPAAQGRAARAGVRPGRAGSRIHAQRAGRDAPRKRVGGAGPAGLSWAIAHDAFRSRSRCPSPSPSPYLASSSRATRST